MTREQFLVNLFLVSDEDGTDGDVSQALKDHDQTQRETIAEQRAEIARLREWQRIVLGTGTDQEAVIRMAAAEYTQVAVQTWKQAYHALMGKAIKMAECITFEFPPDLTEVTSANSFLASPEVQAWREQEGKS